MRVLQGLIESSGWPSDSYGPWTIIHNVLAEMARPPHDPVGTAPKISFESSSLSGFHAIVLQSASRINV